MRKNILLLAVLFGCLMSAHAFVIPTCPDATAKAAADYYLSNPYYAYCADYTECKLSGDNDGTTDFNGGKSVYFDGINISKAGAYKMTLNFKCGQNNASVKMFVNYTEIGVVNIPNSSWAASSIEISGINLVAGNNKIAFQQNAEWPLLHNFELAAYDPTIEADYYLSNPYLAINSQYRDTLDSNNEACKWNEVGYIKMSSDGWSDYHWDGASAVVFDKINMSKAGEYTVTLTYRNNGKVDFVVNGVSTTLTLDGTGTYVIKGVVLKEGMNTIYVKKNDGWIGVKQIAISAGFNPEDIEIGANVTCPADDSAEDFYLNNFYYFLCTTLTSTENPDYPYKNADNENIKVNGNYSDYHWDGPSSVIYDDIKLSTAGTYTLFIYGRGGESDVFDIVVNGTTVENKTYTSGKATSTVVLKKGNNVIKLSKNAGWPGHYAIGLKFISAAEIKTQITLDPNGGNAGAVTSIEATVGQAMPVINTTTNWAPTGATSDKFFNGYWTATTGGVQYYTSAGEGTKNWDIDEETYTLYAQWVEEVIEANIAIDCPDKTEAMTPDYYLTNNYYALCSNCFPKIVIDESTGRKSVELSDGAQVMYNADSAYFKICSDLKYVDFHWNDWKSCDSCPTHKSAINYDNIYVSQSGNYDILYFQRNNGKVDVIVNKDTFAQGVQLSGDTAIIYRVPLKANQANEIKIVKNNGWPQSLGLKLQKSSEVVVETEITLDANGGTGGTTKVVAKKGYDMPEIVLPTRDGYTFEGYYTELEGGEQYYTMTGESFQVWNHDDATFTLYAHWNDGSTGGDCPSDEDKVREDYYISHMYDARCTELTNTWEKDNEEYIYTNVEGEKVKITTNGEWMDFYWTDPSSIVFDNIYVSKDDYYNVTWYFRLDNVDGADEDGSTSHIYVNDELFEDVTVYITDDGVELDQITIYGVELYADWGNKIKILKGNGWVLTRGIQLSRDGDGLDNNQGTPVVRKVMRNGNIYILRGGETYTILGNAVK